MSDNSEAKAIVKKALHLGLEVGVPVAKKVLSSNTGQQLVMLAADMAQEVLYSVNEKTKEKDAPKKAWNESDVATMAEEVRKLTEGLNKKR